LIRYFAYGSNLLSARLQARTPSARPWMRATLAGFSLRFHKIGTDGSGKCDAYRTGLPEDAVQGMVFDLEPGELAVLDAIEGAGSGYERIQRTVQGTVGAAAVWLYVAQGNYIDEGMRPFHWYKRVVIGGAREHGFEETYIAMLSAVPSIADPDWSPAESSHRILRQHAADYFTAWPLQPDLDEDH